MLGVVDERALVILVPEVEAFVRSFREKYDSQASVNIPAHITINHPFVPASTDDSSLDKALLDLFENIRPFQFELSEVRRFPNALWLALDPEDDFNKLIGLTAACFPESPPYGGRFKDIIPHLTVAYVQDSEDIDGMNAVLCALLEEERPIKVRATHAVFIETVGGEWRERGRYEFRGGRKKTINGKQ